MKTDTTDTTPATTSDDVREVKLEAGIQRGEQRITTVQVRKPRAGELRGLSLAELLNMNVDAISAVLPRVTQPMLHKQDVAQLEPADLVGLSVAVVGFLLPKDQQAPSP